MTLEEAISLGVTAVRKPHWDKARLEFHRYKDVSGKPRYGAWATLENPSAEQVLGETSGQLSLLIEGDSDVDWLSCYPL